MTLERLIYSVAAVLVVGAALSCAEDPGGTTEVGTESSDISAISVGNCQSVATDQVCACTSPNFLGTCAVFKASVHFYPYLTANPAISFGGLPNDSIQSMLAGTSVTAEYCVDAEMNGACAKLSAGAQMKTITGTPGPKSISSIRIDRVADACGKSSWSPGARQVGLFAGNNFSGDCTVLTLPSGLGEADYPNTSSLSDVNGLNGSFGLPNDSVSSIKVGSGVRAVMFANAGFVDLANHDLGPKQALYQPGNYATGATGGSPTLGANADNTATAFIVTENHGGTIAQYYETTIPSKASPAWSQDPDGLAHDANYWYITNKWNVYRYGLRDDLAGPPNYYVNMDTLTINSPQGPRHLHYNLDINDPSTVVPFSLQLGCDHFGDPDVVFLQNKYWLLVPVEGCTDPVNGGAITFLAVFDLDNTTSTMPLRCVDELYFQPTNAGMVAVSPTNQNLVYSPGGNITRSPGHAGYEPLYTYWIHDENLPTCDLSRCVTDLNAGLGWSPGCLLTNGPGDSTQPLQVSAGVYSGATQVASYWVDFYNALGPNDASQAAVWAGLASAGEGLNIGEPQGGAFSPDGTLFYLSNGGSYQGSHRDTNALRVFDTTTPVWTEITRAWDDYYGWFSYACEDGCSSAGSQEPEGLDYYDMTNAGGTFTGQLHALLYDNASFSLNASSVYLKHYYTSP